MEKLYDRADIYDLLENDSRYEIIKGHWQYLLEGKSVHSLLDVSIGSGNMTLPVLKLGIELYGSDLSETMLDRCGKKAAAKGYPVSLQCSDFREVSRHFTRQFDCVASTGNSLAYVTNEEVITALRQMDALVAPGGYLYSDFIPITRLFTVIPVSTLYRSGTTIRMGRLISIFCLPLRKKTASSKRSISLSITILCLNGRFWKNCALWGIRMRKYAWFRRSGAHTRTRTTGTV